MIVRAIRNFVVLFALLLSIGSLARAQEKQDNKASNSPSSDPISGAGMYRLYCAVCHGKDARGDGPAASALKVPPPDLTKLTRRHDGKFPDAYVSDVLRNGVKTPAHGSVQMPIWGPLFGSTGGTDPALVSMRIANLTTYIKSLLVR